MTESQARSAIEQAVGSFDTFLEWMRGQTVGMNPDGTADFYEYDVNRFIRYRCTPTNEPLVDYD